MTDEVKGDMPAAEPVKVTAPTQTAQVETWEDGSPFDATKAKTLIEKQRAEMKDLKARAKKADEYEAELVKRKESEMSEIEKATKRADDAERKAAEYERKELQRAAAEKVGLPAAFANRIQGNDPASMEADAQAMLEAMPKAEPKADDKKKPPTIPTSNPAQSAAGETDDQRRVRLGMK